MNARLVRDACRGRMGRVALGLGLGVGVMSTLAAGCGAPSQGNSIAVMASDKTNASGSFRVALTSRTFDTTSPAHVVESGSGSAMVDFVHGRSEVSATTTSYQAGDTGGGGPQQSERIVIGPDSWMKGPLSTNSTGSPLDSAFARTIRRWVHSRRPNAVSQSVFGGLDPTTIIGRLKAKGADLHRLGHESVGGAPTDRYRVNVAPTATTTSNAFFLSKYGFEVWIDNNDLVRRIRFTIYGRAQPKNTPPIPAETNEQTFDLFDFGAAFNIEPPPADQVTEFPSLPTCISSRVTSTTTPGVLICSSPSAPSAPTTVPNLPRATVSGRSALQFRPVRSFRQARCPVPPTNAAADQPATLPGPNGACYDLAPAALVITHAKVVAEANFNNQLEIRLTLGQSDSAALDRLATAYYQRQVAIVMFGRVLSAPTINAQQFNSTAIITPIDPQTAANMIAALSG